MSKKLKMLSFYFYLLLLTVIVLDIFVSVEFCASDIILFMALSVRVPASPIAVY